MILINFNLSLNKITHFAKWPVRGDRTVKEWWGRIEVMGEIRERYKEK